jgi:hypothetical protein
MTGGAVPPVSHPAVARIPAADNPAVRTAVLLIPRTERMAEESLMSNIRLSATRKVRFPATRRILQSTALFRKI